MSAVQSFVPLQSGSWIPLCQYREARNSLVVQIASGRLIISMNTNAPLITDPTLGVIPAGFANALDGSGVPEFRLSRELNGDAVIQEWYGQLQAPLPPTPPTLSGQFFQIGANPTTAIIGGADAGLLVVFALVAGVGATPPSLSSAAMGPIAAFSTQSIAGHFGGTGVLTAYRLAYAGGGDTLTLACGAMFNMLGFVFLINANGLDVGGTSTGSGADCTLAASGLAAQPGETALACAISEFGSTINTWAAPWDSSFATQTIAGAVGEVWAIDLSFLISPSIAIAPAVITFNLGPANFAGIMEAFTLPAVPVAASIATVMESFDDVEAGQPTVSTPTGKTTQISYFDVPLPRLSPDALAALRDLQGRLLIAPGSTDTNAEG